MSVKSTHNPRLYFLGAFFLFWLLLIAFRLVQLQVIHYGEWLQRAQRQQQRTLPVAPRRGVIYDRSGHELAMSIMVDSVFAVPSEVPDPETTALLLARVVGAEPHDLAERLRSPRPFVWVARKVDAETSKRVSDMKLRGIYFQKEPKRFFPKRELAAQTVGYVGLDDEGLGGLEHLYDAELRGKTGKMLITMDARKRWFGRVERQPEPGNNVVLTVDEKIQYIAERELEQAMRDTNAEAGTIVVQNPRTGEILALANRPTFNPNIYKDSPPAALKNRAVSDVFEPGSVFKIVTYSSALEEKLARPDEPIDCQGGVINVGGIRIHDLHKMGVVPVSEALAHSSDVAAVKIGMRLGEERYYNYIRAYGFGQQTGIELPGETRGMARPVSRWSKTSIGAISIGQEIGITPLQLVSMVSTIANDGVYTPPRIVAGVLPPRGTPQTLAFQHAPQHRVVSTMTAAQMRQMLEGVVLFGTGRRAILDGYTSAGKTGTAQKVDPNTGTYSRTKYVATFVGFAPVNNPAVTIAVSLDSPVGLHQGGQVSAPVFARVAQQVLAYWNVAHDAPLNPKRLQIRAAVRNEELDESASDRLGGGWDLDKSAESVARVSDPRPPVSDARPTRAGQTKLIPAAAAAAPLETPASPTAVLAAPADRPAGGTVVLDVGGGVLVPSFIGKTMRSAIEAAQSAGIELQAVGAGVARDQSPAAGTRVPGGSRVTVRFTR